MAKLSTLENERIIRLHSVYGDGSEATAPTRTVRERGASAVTPFPSMWRESSSSSFKPTTLRRGHSSHTMLQLSSTATRAADSSWMSTIASSLACLCPSLCGCFQLRALPDTAIEQLASLIGQRYAKVWQQRPSPLLTFRPMCTHVSNGPRLSLVPAMAGGAAHGRQCCI